MDFFKWLSLEFPELNQHNSKIHLAVWNGQHDPFEVYLEGRFEEWQRWQTKRNFEREFIISLIQLQGDSRWLFAGCYRSISNEYLEEHQNYIYNTQEIDVLSKYSGRIVVSFRRQGRQSYLLSENCVELPSIVELLPKKLEVEPFSGYNRSVVTKSKLDIIVRQNLESWRSALENVSGIYLITDVKTGRLYVGSATGEGGIWQRWRQYSANGHGGNTNLSLLLKKEGDEYALNFQFAILEIADTHASYAQILEREIYWKKLLCTKEHGLNAN